jgi:hypothetical protein
MGFAPAHLVDRKESWLQDNVEELRLGEKEMSTGLH